MRIRRLSDITIGGTYEKSVVDPMCRVGLVVARDFQINGIEAGYLSSTTHPTRKVRMWSVKFHRLDHPVRTPLHGVALFQLASIRMSIRSYFEEASRLGLVLLNEDIPSFCPKCRGGSIVVLKKEELNCFYQVSGTITMRQLVKIEEKVGKGSVRTDGFICTSIGCGHIWGGDEDL